MVKECLLILDFKAQRKTFIGQRKTFYRQRIPQSRKEIVDTDILVTSWNGDRKIMHAIYQNNEYTSLENKEVEPVQPVQMNIYQRLANVSRKGIK